MKQTNPVSVSLRLGWARGVQGALFSTSASGNARLQRETRSRFPRRPRNTGPPRRAGPQNRGICRPDCSRLGARGQQGGATGRAGRVAGRHVADGRNEASPSPAQTVPLPPGPSAPHSWRPSSATIRIHSPHSLPHKQAVHENTTSAGISKHDAHLSTLILFPPRPPGPGPDVKAEPTFRPTAQG